MLGIQQISIHAPLTGSDYATAESQVEMLKFQSTLPSQGATSKVADCIVYTMISIHAPLTGSDSYFAILIIFYTISIHAPLTGSDVQWRRDKPDKFYFNPRSPHRERHYIAFKNVGYMDISIHAPLTGSDTVVAYNASAQTNFNPRSPHRERRAIF